MKNFDDGAHKSQCNHNFYTETYVYMILGLRQSIHTRFLFLRGLLAQISEKICSKRNLVFDSIVIFIHYKMINLDSITNENNKEHNEKWSYIPDHPYRIIIIGGSESGKTNTLLNLIKEQDKHDIIDKIYLYEGI